MRFRKQECCHYILAIFCIPPTLSHTCCLTCLTYATTSPAPTKILISQTKIGENTKQKTWPQVPAQRRGKEVQASGHWPNIFRLSRPAMTTKLTLKYTLSNDRVHNRAILNKLVLLQEEFASEINAQCEMDERISFCQEHMATSPPRSTSQPWLTQQKFVTWYTTTVNILTKNLYLFPPS